MAAALNLLPPLLLLAFEGFGALRINIDEIFMILLDPIIFLKSAKEGQQRVNRGKNTIVQNVSPQETGASATFDFVFELCHSTLEELKS